VASVRTTVALPVARPALDVGAGLVGVAGPLDVVAEDGDGVVGEGARLVVGLDGEAEVGTGLVVAAVVPPAVGGPDEQAVVDSPARPRTVAAASAARVVCGMRHLRPSTLATDPVRAPGVAGTILATPELSRVSARFASPVLTITSEPEQIERGPVSPDRQQHPVST
jgi:hypothetical protein